MCEIILSCGKRKVRGWRGTVRDAVKALHWPRQLYNVMKNVTVLPKIYIQSSLFSAILSSKMWGGERVRSFSTVMSALTLTFLHILKLPTCKTGIKFRESEKALTAQLLFSLGTGQVTTQSTEEMLRRQMEGTQTFSPSISLCFL